MTVVDVPLPPDLGQSQREAIEHLLEEVPLVEHRPEHGDMPDHEKLATRCDICYQTGPLSMARIGDQSFLVHRGCRQRLYRKHTK